MSTPLSGDLRYFGILFGTLILLFVKAVAKDVVDVRFQATSLDYADPDYLGPSTYVRITRNPRIKTPVFTAFLPLRKGMPVETNVTYITFQKQQNAWRSTLIKGTAQLCSLLESKNKLIRMYFGSSDLPRKCPVRKGNYSFKDVWIRGDAFPPLMPSAEWRTKVTWGTPQGTIFAYSFDIKLDRKGRQSGTSDAAAALSVNKTIGLPA